MQKHIKNYLKANNYSPGDFIPCELCGKQVVDIHHIIYRSEKPKHPLIDDPRNLLAVCRPGHTWLHSSKQNRQELVEKRKLKELFDNS